MKDRYAGKVRPLIAVAVLIVAGIPIQPATSRTASGQEKPSANIETKTPDIAQLSWLAGDWESTTSQPYVEEHWTRPAGGTMIGMGRTVAGERTVFFEFLRIEARPDGVYYVAQPEGRPPVDFRAARLTPAEVIFDNPGHSDHLQHIIYRKESDDTISARIEGANNGKAFAEDYHYQRMNRVGSPTVREGVNRPGSLQ